MLYQDFSSLFLQLCQKNSIKDLTEQQIKSFYDFTEHLMQVNKVTNLTAIRDIPSIIAKHYIDSMLLSDHIPQASRVLDIGCGPGFPSLPLAITRPDLQITALDSTQKKIAFVQETAQILQLNNINAISARAEDHELIKTLGKFDIVVSRAVARLNILSELTIPYAKAGGQVLAMKAAKSDEEVAEATNGISKLGGEKPQLHHKNLFLNESEAEYRCIVSILKSKPTPSTYPRQFSVIKKKPL